MPEKRDPATQYSGEAFAVVGPVVQALTKAGWPELLATFRSIRQQWREAIAELTEREATVAGAPGDHWTPSAVVNHQGGFLALAAKIMRGAVSGHDQVMEGIDDQWLGDDLGFADLLGLCERAFADFEAAAEEASRASAPTGSVTTPYLIAGDTRLWMRNCVIHTAEHVAHMRKVRGFGSGGYPEVVKVITRAGQLD